MKPRLVITSPARPGLALESIDASHLELLRRWKNADRHRFFFQREITPAGQREWFHGYLARPDDWIFVIRSGTELAGSLGYRLLDDGADVYNVLREPALSHRSTAHAHAVALLAAYIAQTHAVPIRGRVLADNPAHRWARVHGFRIVGEGARDGLAYKLLEYDPARLVAYPLTVHRTPPPQP